MITLITVAILFLILYFSLSGLLISRRLRKRTFTTIDLSSQIFAANLHLPRHILRRIWMDTWSVLFLCHRKTKMKTTQPVIFHNTPPYLLGFNGSIAERHVENLKMMRTFGSRKYIEACRELTTEETLLRQKVYNFFCGPGSFLLFSVYEDCFYWPVKQKIDGVTTWFGKGISDFWN
jgi:hypothetical protein